MIKKTATVCLLAYIFSGCALADSSTSSSSSDSQSLAAAWCEKRGGKVYGIKPATTKATNKNISKCLLPSGELVEIWALYKRDHK